MQKELIFISGTIGTGKTTLAKKIVNSIPNAIMLDGDWCFTQGLTWYFDEQTKKMAIDNIIYLLNNYLDNDNFDYIIFSWTLHQQEIIDTILNNLNFDKIKNFRHFLLVCDEPAIRERIEKRFEEQQKELGIQYTESDIDKMVLGSIKKLSFYNNSDAIRLDASQNIDSLSNSVLGYLESGQNLKKIK